MPFAAQKIVVARHHPARLEPPDFFGAGGNQFRRAVQDRRWTVDVEKIAGEHVAAEQQIMLCAEKSAVAERVARQMHHLQFAPERQLLTVGQEFINQRGPVPQHSPPDGLEPAAPAIDALVGIRAFNVSCSAGWANTVAPVHCLSHARLPA